MILRILDTPAGETFVAETASYRKYMKEHVERFPELIYRITAIDPRTDELEFYRENMRWGIRQLEYSFILNHLPEKTNLRILDI